MYEFTMWVPRLAMGQARAAFLLLVLIFLQGVTALQTSDEANLLRFLEAAQPGYRSVYNTSVPACEWTGVVDCLIGLGAQRRITSLSFSGRGMNGTILPKTLAALTALTSLDLSNNALTGDIPLDLFTFSSLTVLSLGNNKLTGGLHPFVSSLRQLVTLDLSHNFLSGSLPKTLGDFRFLISLYLHSNNFTGTIPVFSYPLSLQHLDLSHNHLTGEVPWAFDKLTQLTHLNLSTNLLTRPITWQFGNLQALQVLDISRNDFEGPIPSFGSLQVLTAVSLSGNRFNGSIPEPLIGLPGLQRLSLANNRLTGPLPPLSPSISFLDCSGNSLSGSIPDGGFGTLSIKVVRLASNNFTGPLPSAVAPQVQELDLQSNGFNGSIPERLAALPGLEKLELSGNQLTGIIPWDFVRLSTIRHVGLARNAFLPGVLPVANLQMVNILFLNLSFCNLGGPIPASFAALHSLIRLDLSHNHFTSTIPAGLSRSAALETLNLSFNNLTGAIPPELTSLPVLAFLNFSYNNLSGEVPSFWDNYDSAAFQGNPQLCGYVLKRVCPGSSSAPTVAPFHRRRRGLSVGAIIGIVIGTVVSFCGFLGLLILFLNHKPRKLAAKDVSKFLSSKLPVTFEADPSTWAVQVSSASSIPVIMFEKPLLNLTFADLLHATANFHKDNQISDGGYGPTYKGALAGGFQIVVKVLFEGGPANEFEKAAQLEALGKIRHPNLVSLVGYCLVGEERLLVYEFMENGDAHRRLHDLPEGNHDPEDWSKDTWENPETESEDLSWPIRHRIALGVARALAFLHHGCSPHLVHRDVTSSNILLDSSYEPHLADCGLAGLMISDKPTVGGAMGYVPPEYGQIWKATPRGDVYSFGVVLLELVTGKRPTGQYFHDSYGGNLVGWVRALIREKRGYKCLDPRLASSGVESEMLETLRIGYLCTAELPAKRPTMQQIVGLLKDIQNPEFMA